MSKEEAHLEFANNGQEACDKALTEAYDIILMDVQMPVMDGYAATRFLRAKGYTSPIIALTAHAMIEDQQRSIREGCTAHVIKPVARKALIEIIKSLLK